MIRFDRLILFWTIKADFWQFLSQVVGHFCEIFKNMYISRFFPSLDLKKWKHAAATFLLWCTLHIRSTRQCLYRQRCYDICGFAHADPTYADDTCGPDFCGRHMRTTLPDPTFADDTCGPDICGLHYFLAIINLPKLTQIISHIPIIKIIFL